jgi:hypothetical protein
MTSGVFPGLENSKPYCTSFFNAMAPKSCSCPLNRITASFRRESGEQKKRETIINPIEQGFLSLDFIIV